MIIGRYLRREIVTTWIGVVTVILLIATCDRFVRYLSQAAEARISGDLLLSVLGLKIASSLGLLLPVTVFLAVLIALGRFHQDFEFVALGSAGVAPANVLREVLIFVALAALFIGTLTLVLLPRVAAVKQRVHAQARETAFASAVGPGKFREYGNTGTVFYVERVEAGGQRLHNIFIHKPGNGNEVLMFAKRASQWIDADTGEHKIRLQDGRRYEGLPGKNSYTITRFQGYTIRLGRQEIPRSSLDAEPTTRLVERNDVEARSELQWRIALPVSTLLFGVLAVPLSRTAPGTGRYARVLPSIIIYLIYNNILEIVRSLATRESVPPVIGFWLAHTALALLTAVMLFRDSKGWRRGPLV